jgi:hypothetical protein
MYPVKRLIASLLSVAFVTGMLVTMTGCPSDAKKAPDNKAGEKKTDEKKGS